MPIRRIKSYDYSVRNAISLKNLGVKIGFASLSLIYMSEFFSAIKLRHARGYSKSKIKLVNFNYHRPMNWKEKSPWMGKNSLQSSMVPFITILHSIRLRLYGMRYWMSYERFTKMSFGGWSLTSKTKKTHRMSVRRVVDVKLFFHSHRLSIIKFSYTLKQTRVSLIARNKELIPLIRRIEEITNCLQWPVAIDIVIELMAGRVLVFCCDSNRGIQRHHNQSSRHEELKNQLNSLPFIRNKQNTVN